MKFECFPLNLIWAAIIATLLILLNHNTLICTANNIYHFNKLSKKAYLRPKAIGHFINIGNTFESSRRSRCSDSITLSYPSIRKPNSRQNCHVEKSFEEKRKQWNLFENTRYFIRAFLQFIIWLFDGIFGCFEGEGHQNYGPDIKKNNHSLKYGSYSPRSVFVNPKSGGKIGGRILDKLYDYLPVDNICNLQKENPDEKLLNLVHQLQLKAFNNEVDNSSLAIVLVCRGDGTVRWLMDATIRLNITDKVAFGFIPLGTGNDLYNHLSLTQKQKRVLSSSALLQSVSSALDLFNSCKIAGPEAKAIATTTTNSCLLDRWSLNFHDKDDKEDKDFQNSFEIEPVKKVDEKILKIEPDEILDRDFKDESNRQKLKKYVQSVKEQLLLSPFEKNEVLFNNYFGIGVDGAISNCYGNLRNKIGFLFFNRIINKMWYGIIWFYKLLEGRNNNLSTSLELYCDNKKLELPNGIRGIIVVNIRSYAGGTDLWNVPKSVNIPRKYGNWHHQKSDDGIIEVIGLYSLTHLAKIKSGLGVPLRLAQCKSLRFLTKRTLPMQVDGEPWIQKPVQVDLSHSGQVNIALPSI